MRHSWNSPDLYQLLLSNYSWHSDAGSVWADPGLLASVPEARQRDTRFPGISIVLGVMIVIQRHFMIREDVCCFYTNALTLVLGLEHL